MSRSVSKLVRSCVREHILEGGSSPNWLMQVEEVRREFISWNAVRAMLSDRHPPTSKQFAFMRHFYPAECCAKNPLLLLLFVILLSTLLLVPVIVRSFLLLLLSETCSLLSCIYFAAGRFPEIRGTLLLGIPILRIPVSRGVYYWDPPT